MRGIFGSVALAALVMVGTPAAAAVVATPATSSQIVPANMKGPVSTVFTAQPVIVDNPDEAQLEGLDYLSEDFGYLPLRETFHSNFSGLLTGANVSMSFGEENGMILPDQFSFDLITPQGDVSFAQPDYFNPIEGFFPAFTTLYDPSAAEGGYDRNPALSYGIDSNGDVAGVQVKDGEVLTFEMPNPVTLLLSAQSGPFATTWSDFSFFGIRDPGVPEPSIWAMLIAGIGMVGGARRASRNKAVTTAAT